MKNEKSKMQNGKTKKSLKKDERAVSPVVGVIMMVAITVVIAAVVAAFAYGIIGGVKRAPNTALVVEDAVPNSKNVTIIHHGGDTIVNAFNPTNLTKADECGGKWKNLEVRKNGAKMNCWTAMNGTECDEVWASDFHSGDEIEIGLGTGLESGDSIAVVYTPTGDLLQRVTVTS